MSHRHRRREAAPAGDLLADVLRLVPNLSDEEWAARDASVAAFLAKEQATDRLGELLDLGFPRRAVDVIRAGADTTVEAIAWLPGPSEGEIVVLNGPKGCGKTVAATWWASQRRDRVRFLRASRFAADSRYDQDARSRWSSGALVLDDLGAEYVDAKGSFLADLDELVDTFYGDRRALLITTNCTTDEFCERYGARIHDRLRECGCWIALGGESLRGRST